ncbi:MAG TPA: hypothetical protein VHT96_17620 [Clostridia bacterium]|nr:hypothetical protein [Clostridia bacterium]
MQERHKGIGFGILLLTVGALWLLGLAHIVTINTFFAFLALWPLILVVIGISIMFRNNRFVRAGAWLVLVAVVVCYGYFGTPARSPFISGSFIVDEKWSGERETVKFEKNPQTENAELQLKFGASKLNIDSSASGLLEADIVKDAVRYSKPSDSDRTPRLEFEMRNFNIGMLKDDASMVSRFSLNKDVVWKIDIQTGAESDDIDLSGLKTEKLELKTGMSEIKLKMGSYDTDINIDAGASKIDITLPEDTGMRIKLDGGVNSTNIDGSDWTKDGDWHYSPGYNEKSHKITADIHMGVGNLTVE